MPRHMRLVFLSICLSICVQSDENVKIKIVQAPALSRFPAVPNSRNPLTLRAKPAAVTGPKHLQLLNGTCFKGHQDKYTYDVCPFQNVTQTEGKSGWSSFRGVLGVWYEWLFTNDTFGGMHFTMGEPCGSMDREVMIMFNCSTVTRVHNASEPSTCKYVIWLDTPLACFEGAMQVYHLLSAKQLEEWDEAEQEFYNEEITYQGLERRRRHILTECGFLQKRLVADQKQDESVTQDKETPLVPVENNDEVSFSEKLKTCSQENDVLKNHLEHMNSKIAIIIKEYPNIAVRLGFTSNDTSERLQGNNGPGVHAEETLKVDEDAEHNMAGDQNQQRLFYDYLYSLAQHDITDEHKTKHPTQSEVNNEIQSRIDIDRQLLDILSDKKD